MELDFTTIDWKAVIAGGALLVALVTLIYFTWWKNRRRLSYEVVSNTALISHDERIKDDIEIRFRGLPVRNVRLFVVKLINDGYQPVKKDDFERPIALHFPNGQVFTADVVDSRPEYLIEEMSYEGEIVTLAPTLFNRGDFVTLSILVSTSENFFSVAARIVGVSKVTDITTRFGSPKNIFIQTLIWIVIMAAMFFLTSGFFFLKKYFQN